NGTFEKVTSFGLLPNMILYLLSDYHMSVALGANVLLIWSAATNFLRLVGAFLVDPLLGRFLAIFSWFYLQSHAFALMSTRAGGIRPCSLAFSVNLIDCKDNPKRERKVTLRDSSDGSWNYRNDTKVDTPTKNLSHEFPANSWCFSCRSPSWSVPRHFSWLYLQSHGMILLWLTTMLPNAKPPPCDLRWYRWLGKTERLRYGIQVRSWNYRNYTKVDTPTKNLRLLNKACILTKPEDTNKDPWSLCTVEQVEELRVLIRVIPLWSSSIMLSVNMNQSAFPILQAKTMDQHVTKNFEMPPASLGFFNIVKLMGMILLWLTTMLPNAKPPSCDLRVPKSCQSPTPVQYTLLFTAFALMSTGAALMGVLIAFTGIVNIQDHHGWRVGFGIPVVLMPISTLSFIVAYPLYYKMKVEKSLFASLCQVVSAAWKNRKVMPPDSSDGSWYHWNDSKVATPTKNLSVKLRMGACLVFSILAMVTSGIIEHIRKQKAIEEGFFNDSQAVVKMLAMWLVPQQLFHGISESLNIIGQMEFYYSEFPKSMSRVATSLYLHGAGIGSLLGSLVLRSVNAITKQEGKESWVSTNINKGHYDNDYWLLAINELCKFFLLCGV
nr:hypothetical protein [Tanacetum cinerariifolium]